MTANTLKLIRFHHKHKDTHTPTTVQMSELEHWAARTMKAEHYDISVLVNVLFFFNYCLTFLLPFGLCS